MYQYALSRLKLSDRIVMSFLQRLQTFRQPSTDDPSSITNYANFISSLVDTFTQLNFLHDIHSTVNLTSALSKLPADVRLNWNRHVLSQNIKDPSLRNFALWLQNFATACRDSFIPFSDTNHNGRSSSSTNARAQGHNSKTPFVKPSSQFSLCPEKKGCVYLGSCEHFKAFSPIDRKNYDKKYHLCFNCLKGHNFNDCKSTKVCQQPGCMKKHHTLLHIDRQCQNQIQSSTLSTSRLLNPGLRPIVPVTVSSGGKTADVFALLDTGSSVSLITKKIAEHLVGHLPESSPILLEGVNTTSTVAAISLDLTIAPYNAAAAMPLRNVLAVPTLNLQTFDSAPINSFCQQYPHLQHVSFPYLKQLTVDLLIGSDQFDLIHSRTVIRGPPNTPCAMSTKLGWTVAGRSILPTTAATNVTNLRSRHEALFQQVQEWMHIDCSGITSSKKSLSAEDQQALSILKKTTKLVDGHYEIGLLWKNHVSLPNNKWVAQKQLSSLEIKLARKPQLGSLYEASIATDIEKGYVSVVPDSEANREHAWYLPHHPVTNVNKPGKIRRVTNASSVYQGGTSLNSSLLKGPDLLCNLTGLIMRFREKCVALSADIEAMFMQVSVPPSDRRFLRYLWRNEVHEYNRHIFGATDSPCAACYAVRQCAEDNKTAYPDAPNLVARHIYMDDLYVSTDTLEEAKNLRTVLQTVLATGGFNLTKWTSNNLEFNQSIPESDRSNSAPINPNKKVIDKVLGVKWNTIDDCYLLEPTNFQDTPKKLTHRTLLKYVSSIFDPLGMSSPIQIRVRTSLQQIWKGNQHWDRPIALADYPEL